MPAADEKLDWLASVKEATLDFLRKALADRPPAKQTETKPSAARRTSLTVPVTAVAKDVAMDGGVSWWSEWATSQPLDAKKGEELSQIVKQEFAPLNDRSARSAPGARLEELSENSAKRTGLATIGPLMRLANVFRTLQAGEIGRTSEERRSIAGFAAEYDGAINRACLAIAIQEKVTQQIRALFTPPKTAK